MSSCRLFATGAFAPIPSSHQEEDLNLRVELPTHSLVVRDLQAMLSKYSLAVIGRKGFLPFLIVGLWLTVFAACAAKGTVALKDLPDNWPPLGTTKQEVQDRLGEPSTRSMSVEGDHPEERWSYEYAAGQDNLFLHAVSEIAVSATDLERSGEAKHLIVTFDHDGKVIGRSVRTEKTGVEPAGPTDAYVR